MEVFDLHHSVLQTLLQNLHPKSGPKDLHGKGTYAFCASPKGYAHRDSPACLTLYLRAALGEWTVRTSGPPSSCSAERCPGAGQVPEFRHHPFLLLASVDCKTWISQSHHSKPEEETSRATG